MQTMKDEEGKVDVTSGQLYGNDTGLTFSMQVGIPYFKAELMRNPTEITNAFRLICSIRFVIAVGR